MDLSIGKIKSKNNLNFKGVKATFGTDNTPVYEFIAPPFDRRKEKATLEIALLNKDKNNQYIPPKSKDFLSAEFDSDEPIKLSQDALRKYSDAFAYRYKITDKNGNNARYMADSYKKIKTAEGAEMNLFTHGPFNIITPTGGLMYHVLVDSGAALNVDGSLKQYDWDFVRNHFNKLGGSIKGLTYLLENTNELDNFKRIITTPDIGADRISSHGYWPCNQYQCKDIEAFKEFVFKLYKKGKRYVADGAFTSQGLQSPLVHHVMKWGEESPFYHMLKIDGALQLGVLPDRSTDGAAQGLDYIGVRLVNGPKDKNYDKTKPTYMQFFDSRLSDENQQYSNELIETYNKKPGQDYDISTHQDSVWPYYYEIEPDDKTRLKAFGDKKVLMLNEIENLGDFLIFPNYEIAYKSSASGADFWDGNRDIIKMNLSNPTSDPDDIKGFRNARKYLYGVAAFWSETMQSELLLKTAMMNANEKHEVALNNDISEKDYQEIINSLDEMVSPVLSENKTVKDYMKEFPLQSIETNPDLSAVFSEPGFNELFFAGETGKQVEAIVQNVIDAAIPQEFAGNSEYRTYVTKMYAPSIIKNILMGSMCPKAIKEGGIADLNILKDVSLASLGAGRALSPEDERNIVISKLRKGINKENTEKILKRMQQELKNVTLRDFKLAESIVLQGKAGLEWRFDAAKDVGDMVAVRNYATSFQYIFEGDEERPGVIDFWKNFIQGAAKYNPALYTITEMTDLWSFADESKNMPDKFFDKNLKNYYDSLSEHEKSINENKLPYLKEMEFLSATGSTTASNYNTYFNNLINFIGVDAERGTNQGGSAGNIENLKSKTESFINSAQVNNALLTHMFFENHDKPRILHFIGLNCKLFFAKSLESLPEFHGDIKRLTGGREDYKDISPKAIAVGLLMEKTINDIYKDDKEKREHLLHSLENLVNGKDEDDSKPNFGKAETFGKRPYLTTVRDLFNNAGEEDNDEVIKFCFAMLQKSMKIESNLWEIMCALAGTPTAYYGIEYGQTGYETPSRNQDVGNRAQTARFLKEKPGYSEFYNEFQGIASLSGMPELSALRNGHPISLGISTASTTPIEVHQGALRYFKQRVLNYSNETGRSPESIIGQVESIVNNKDEFYKFLSNNLKIANDNNNFENFRKAIPALKTPSIDVWPLFKYDERGSRTISLITNNGIPTGRNSNEVDASVGRYCAKSIPIKDASGICPLEEGLKLKKKIFVEGNKFVDEDRTYIVRNGELCAQDGQPVYINRTVETFYVPKESNMEVNYMASLYNTIH